MAGYTELTVKTAGIGVLELATDKTDVDNTNGNYFANDGSVRFLLKNSDGADSATVTVKTGATLYGKAVDDESAVTLASGAVRPFGPFPPDLYNVQSGTYNGAVQLDFGGTAAAALDILVYR